MKNVLLFLALGLLWGCNDKSMGPASGNPDVENQSYGSSVIKLPNLALAKVAASSVVYKFSLTITGDNMEPMFFDWPVNGSGESFTIDRIPSGRSRQFEGRLYGSNGATYEGKAFADIVGGQVTYVSLVLRKTGSALVEVIIEDGELYDTLAGCFGLKGEIGSTDISDLTLEIPPTSNGQFWGYIKRADLMIGKCWGTITNWKLDGYISIPELDIEGVISGDVTIDFRNIKAEVFSRDTSERIGSFFGYQVECNSAVPADCQQDTLGGPGSTSCKDTTTWKIYAADACKQSGKIITSYSFLSNCDKKDESFFEGICFECCTLVK